MIRIYNSKDYKWTFNTETGLFNRWGEGVKDDPQFSPIGPEILDIEVSTICHQGCKFCYKGNTPVGKNMSFETFKNIFDKIKGNLTQVAFGIGDLTANPELNMMMAYCRDNNVIPNITINGFNLTDDWVNYLSTMCGAVSVSNYDTDVCYSAVKRLTDAGLKQTNIHQLLSEETLKDCLVVAGDILSDPRLAKLNAIVFLSLKQKGRGVKYNPISYREFSDFVDIVLKSGINFGFDSCAATKFLRYISDHPKYRQMKRYIEPCESALFSSYINVDGLFFPCSFTEGYEEFLFKHIGLDVVNCKDFIKDIWEHSQTLQWRQRLLNYGRNCPIYRI